jgi:hypothetical protein
MAPQLLANLDSDQRGARGVETKVRGERTAELFGLVTIGDIRQRSVWIPSERVLHQKTAHVDF